MGKSKGLKKDFPNLFDRARIDNPDFLNSNRFLAEFIKKKRLKAPIPIETKCPECRSTNLIWDYNLGETICRGCGLVIEEQMMDKGPEWRAFTQEEKASRSRVGVITSYSVHDKGLSTSIEEVDRDAFGRKLPISTRLQMWRLRKWQIRSRVHCSKDRNLAQAMAELGRLSDKLYIPSSVKEKAAIIYRKALEKGLVRGRSIAVVAAASLYAACRFTRTPRSLREISEFSSGDKKEVGRCYRLLLRELGIRMPLVNPLMYICKIAERTDISGLTQGLAIKIFQEAKRKVALAGKDPKGLAAAVLYIACRKMNEKKRQQDIAIAADVTDTTVRNHCKILQSKLSLKILE